MQLVERVKEIASSKGVTPGQLALAWLLAKSDDFFVGRTVSSEAIKTHHRQMMELATVALTEQRLDERDFSGTTVAIRKQDVPLVTEEIYKFHRWLTSIAAKQNNPDSLYRLNVQLFKLDEAQ